MHLRASATAKIEAKLPLCGLALGGQARWPCRDADGHAWRAPHRGKARLDLDGVS
jgi:hypothetical protein